MLRGTSATKIFIEVEDEIKRFICKQEKRLKNHENVEEISLLDNNKKVKIVICSGSFTYDSTKVIDNTGAKIRLIF